MEIQVQRLQQQLIRMQPERSAHPQRVSRPVQVTLEMPTEEEYEDEEEEGPRYPHRPYREPKLLPLAPDDDIEHFLTTFERMAQVCRWPEEEWAVRLVPLLTGKARSAYVAMDMKDTEDYDKVKEAILSKYEITTETYRRRFRSLKIEPGETPRELYVRLKELFMRWIQPGKITIQQVCENLILEQFLRMVSPELEIWIKEHDPATAEEAARLAEVFTSARKGTRTSYFGREPHQPMPSKSFGGDGCGPAQGRSSNSRPAPPIHQSRTVRKPARPPQEVRCYNCNELGHTQYFCPALKTKHSLLCSVPRPASVQTGQRIGRTTPVLVNGHRAEALLDSGCFQTVVMSSLVPPERQSVEQTPLVCIHGDEHSYPTAEVYLTVGGQTYLVTVALAKNLPFAVILGNDIPTLPDLIVQADSGCSESVLEPPAQCTPEPGKPCNVLTRAQIARGVFEELPFCDEELEAHPVKAKKPKAQKRRDKFVGSQKEKEELPKPLSPLDVSIPQT
ncbi:hypothetical protein NL108_007232 [Boleophthalmus pectinirostris]|nr:hypothetical protein NL108_007232 [Boleophthalmus pectinirostris]